MEHAPEKNKSLPALHNLDAEQALLGALLFHNDWLDRIPPLTGAEFHDPVHARIFVAVLERRRAGRLADAVTLTDWARADEGMRDLGGPKYLLALLENAAPLSTHAVEYAGIVRDQWVRREILSATDDIAALAQASDDLDAGAIVTLAEQRLRAIKIPSGDSVVSIGDLVAERARSFASSSPGLIPTGIPDLDRRFGGFGKSELILFAGRPSMGKSALLANCALSMGKRGLRGHFASAEMSKEQVADRTLSAASWAEPSAAFQYRALRSPYGRVPTSELVAGLAAAYADYPILYDFAPIQSVAHIAREARRTAQELGGLDWIAIDHTHRLKSDGKERSAVERYDAIAEGIKNLARDLKAPVIAAAQLNRASEQEENKRPTLANLRNSGAFEMEADVVVLVHRESYYLARREPQRGAYADHEAFNEAKAKWEVHMRAAQGKLELHTAKQRQGEPGIDLVEFNEGYDVIRSLKWGAAP